MRRKYRTAIWLLRSDNPKAAPQTKIVNPKLLVLSVIAFVLVVVVAAADAQQPKKLFRIGYLSNTSPSAESTRSEAVGKRLRELGFVVNQQTAKKIGVTINTDVLARATKIIR